MWSFESEGAIFGSPTISDGKIYFGNDNGCLYCLNCDGDELFCVKLEAQIPGTPMILKCDGGNFGVLALKNGRVILFCAESGSILSDFGLSGQLFSSPVCVGNYVWIGSRDDHLYCLRFLT